MLLYDYRTIEVEIFNGKSINGRSINERSTKQLMFPSVVKITGPRVSEAPKLIHRRPIWWDIYSFLLVSSRDSSHKGL